ncbi:MAG: ORF6N domain-containing protein [Bacteroidaceae bacterium]|nr:ORF6N domain-containing protein [Bacteroidaceae bacterium]MBR6855883.1 ORF6N domain-containing protein [Bacteroidaceae bacterium]
MKNKIVTFEQVRDKIVNIRGQQVIPDFAVAALYGVETREINQAVKNNPRKFPKGWLLVLDNQESAFLRSKFLMLDNKTGRGNYSKHNYKAFTERGIYMLATILKGDRATDTTIVIIDTFAKLRELSQSIKEIANNPDKDQQKSLIQKSGVIMEDLFGEALSTSETETEIELNFAVLKLKHTIKRKKGETDL